jgi:hypothetical protein
MILAWVLFLELVYYSMNKLNELIEMWDNNIDRFKHIVKIKSPN